MDFLPPLPLLIAFCGASVLLAVTPGPAVFYIITRSLAQGRRAGLASVAGVALGNLGNALGAALGLAALFAISSLAFTVVKYAGAAYLVYLGIKALRKPAEVGQAALGTADTRRIFRDGFLVALLNPKTAIFFAAFLPQFMSPNGSVVGQSLLLGATFVAIAGTTDTIYATAAGTIAPRLRGNKRAGTAGRYVTASAFIGLGLFTALSGSSRAK
jgi:threonine/homoserine/homoserine lactone efflux protein